MEVVALNKDKNGQFTISYENGKLKREQAELSFAKHNLLCFGRGNKNIAKNPTLRRGAIGDFLEGSPLYSNAWIYYLEGVITLNSMQKIIQFFNAACNRDFKNKLFENRIALQSVRKLDKNTIQFTINIGNAPKDIIINI